MGNARLRQMHLDNFDDILEDVLNRGNVPPLVIELKKKHPKVDLKDLILLVASSWALLDTIDEYNNSKEMK